MIDALGRATAVSDLFRIYSNVQDEGGQFRWTTIANDVPMGGDEVFDPAQMLRLYEVGYRLGAGGGEWLTAPPGQRREP